MRVQGKAESSRTRSEAEASLAEVQPDTSTEADALAKPEPHSISAMSVKVVYERLRSIHSSDAQLAMSWDGTSSRFSSSMTVAGMSLACEPALM